MTRLWAERVNGVANFCVEEEPHEHCLPAPPVTVHPSKDRLRYQAMRNADMTMRTEIGTAAWDAMWNESYRVFPLWRRIRSITRRLDMALVEWGLQ